MLLKTVVIRLWVDHFYHNDLYEESSVRKKVRFNLQRNVQHIVLMDKITKHSAYGSLERDLHSITNVFFHSNTTFMQFSMTSSRIDGKEMCHKDLESCTCRSFTIKSEDF